MPVFMVERYLPSLEPATVEAQARQDAALGSESAVRHVRTTYSREDELCFSFFEASSREALTAALEPGATPYERITEVVDVDATNGEPSASSSP